MTPYIDGPQEKTSFLKKLKGLVTETGERGKTAQDAYEQELLPKGRGEKYPLRCNRTQKAYKVATNEVHEQGAVGKRYAQELRHTVGNPVAHYAAKEPAKAHPHCKRKALEHFSPPKTSEAEEMKPRYKDGTHNTHRNQHESDVTYNKPSETLVTHILSIPL